MIRKFNRVSKMPKTRSLTKNAKKNTGLNERVFNMIHAQVTYDKHTLAIESPFQLIAESKDNQGMSAWSETFGHTIPTREALQEVSNVLKGKTTLSIGSGLGLWEYLLMNTGCYIIAVDICVDSRSYMTTLQLPKQIDVYTHLIAEQVISRSADIDALLLIWSEPDWEDNRYKETGYDARALENFEGTLVIVICDDVTTEEVDDSKVTTADHEQQSYKQVPIVCTQCCRRILQDQFSCVRSIQLPHVIQLNYRPVVRIFERTRN
jgi:hypothetical protein